MKIRTHTTNRLYITVTCLVAMLSAFYLNTAHADKVILKDGSRIVGTVVSMKSKKLVFKTSFAGNITIKWDQVARLTTDKPVEVSLGDKDIYTGKVVQSDEGSIVLQPEKGPKGDPIAMADVKTLSSPKAPPKWEFDGRISLGVSYEEGNTEKDKFNLDGRLDLYKGPNRLRSDFEIENEKAFNVTTKDRSRVNLAYDRFLTENWFARIAGAFEQDEFADLDSLWVAFIGPGYQFWRSKDDKNLLIAAGPGYASEHFSEPQKSLGGEDNREYAAAGWQVDFDIWLLNKRIQPFFSNSGLMSLEDSSVWRSIIRTGLRFPILYGLFGSIQYNWDWVNQPADGAREFDEGIFIKLGYGW